MPDPLVPPHAPPMPVRRTLPDGCGQCGVSEIACDAHHHLTYNPCCSGCTHERN